MHSNERTAHSARTKCALNTKQVRTVKHVYRTQQISVKCSRNCPRGSPPLGPITGPITYAPPRGYQYAAPQPWVTHVSRHVGNEKKAATSCGSGNFYSSAASTACVSETDQMSSPREELLENVCGTVIKVQNASKRPRAHPSPPVTALLGYSVHATACRCLHISSFDVGLESRRQKKNGSPQSPKKTPRAPKNVRMPYASMAKPDATEASIIPRE